MKVNWRKKCILDYFFFFIDAGASAFGPDCSIVTKQDSRCRHTYVFIVYKVSLEHDFVGSLFEAYIIREATKGGALLAGSSTFEHFCSERQI